VELQPAATESTAGGVDMKKTNILYIITDQQSASMMSCRGNKWLSTPHMDSLAAGGVLFNRAYCSNPVCLPSRVSLLSGFYPGRLNIKRNEDCPEAKADNTILNQGLGHLLKEQGYAAGYGGKIHLPPNMQPQDLGFDYIEGDEREELAESCGRFIKENRNKPFCLTASFINPHDICYMAIRDYGLANGDNQQVNNLLKHADVELETLDRCLALPKGISEEEFYQKYCPPLPDNHQRQTKEPENIREFRKERPFKQYAMENYDEKRWRLHRWAYARLTEEVDRQIGKVLQTLKEEGLEEETLIIFTSDHGDNDSSHMLEHKTVFYEESIHIPLIISQKGKTRSRISEEIVCNGLDLIPTILETAGVSVPENLPGKSLLPVINEENNAPIRDHLIVESQLGKAVVTDKYKYISYDWCCHEESFFDLSLDPGEKEERIGKKEYEGVVKRMRDFFPT
jgi:arylsulfatase A-like enzyme